MHGSTKAGGDMQKQMTNLQPKMNEIQEKYKDNPEKQSEEVMKLFKTQGAGPLKGCLTMLLQIPVFIGLLYTVQEFAKGEIRDGMIYSFLTNLNITIAQVNPWFLGMNLLTTQNIVLTILAALLMYIQMTMMQVVQPKPAVPAALTG
jgi:YidC/Oxa1 family membrane protein insertase